MQRVWVLMMFGALSAAGPVFAATAQPLPPELQKLEIFTGHWVFHGQTLETSSGKAGNWTWDESCGWSEGQVFLLCSFTNVWFGKTIKSLVVDTYNGHDHGFWHYEMFAVGASGARPFVSRMTVQGDTWIETGQDENHGKKVSERVVYRYTSPTRVSVEIQVSRDGAHWTTVDRGEGVKQA